MSQTILDLKKSQDYKDNQSKILETQEKNVLEELPLSISKSVMKVATYLSRELQINDLSEISVEHLLNYFYEQRRQNFSSSNFQETIKDIKNVILYLKEYREIQNPPYINFSVQNHRLWKRV